MVGVSTKMAKQAYTRNQFTSQGTQGPQHVSQAMVSLRFWCRGVLLPATSQTSVPAAFARFGAS